MRMFAIAADVAMGACLGVFAYAMFVQTWPELRHPLIAAVVVATSIAIVLIRRPGGTLAKWWQDRAGR